MDNDSSSSTILIHQLERMYYTKRTDWKNFPVQESTRTKMETDTAVSYHFLPHLRLPEIIWKYKNIKKWDQMDAHFLKSKISCLETQEKMS